MDRRDERSLEALEQQVPDALVEGMWDDVQAGLRARRRSRATPTRGVGGPRGGRRWVVPALVAAALVLLLANGLTLRALRDAQERQAVLAEQLLDQQRRLTELETPQEARGVTLAGRRAALLGRATLNGRDAWVRALEDRESLTVADLRDLLEQLPAETRLVSPARARQLASSRLVPSMWRDAFAQVDPATGVTAREFLGILDHLDLPGGASVPAARLVDLLS